MSHLNHTAVERSFRGLPLGAQALGGGRVRFRVWASQSEQVEVIITGHRKRVLPLAREQGAFKYFSGIFSGIPAGSLYMFRLDGREYPDICSRYQPKGPEGPSMVIDPFRFKWKDRGWRGLQPAGQVLYELHIGTFTPQGTFRAAARQLSELARLGITAVEVMPVAECAGSRNWGYDGVDLFAPYHVYGFPDDFKYFVDTAHSLGIGVILDVVYNHIGPRGNFLREFCPCFFGTTSTEWGEGINFDGPSARPVRDFFVHNACYWIREYHCDGLRLDATQNIVDTSEIHILSEMNQACRAAAGRKKIFLIAENEPQDVRCLAPVEEGGFGFDAVWNDDFHHSCRTALTGMREAYYIDYRGSPQEFVSMAKRCFLYQGQEYLWQKKKRGTFVSRERASSFIVYLQNHDQIGNTLKGERINALVNIDRYRALAMFMLLSPMTPMLFMGQEFAASSPFPFFSDITGLDGSILAGRKKFLSQFKSFSSARSLSRIPAPSKLSTFLSAKLDFNERKTHSAMYRFHRDLIRLRREDPVVRELSRFDIDGAVLGESVFILRYFSRSRGDRLLAVNLGARKFTCAPCPEPLISSGSEGNWELIVSSHDARYGGAGAGREWEQTRAIPARAALFFKLTKGYYG